MIELRVFPGGKKRIVTFSYDDGHEYDERLINMFNKYGVKGTFHLNGGVYDEKAIPMQTLQKRYEGHEISCHTAKHGWLSSVPYQSVVDEIVSNRLLLEKVAKHPIVGMSYPCSHYAYNEAVKQAMKMCGILYARTTKETMKFHLPDDFLEWHPTCHHKDAGALCDKFLCNIDSYYGGTLFYIWGHSHEFKTEEDWALMENILEKLSGNEKIWYATNFEIYQYITAQRSLIISIDETVVYNPTSIPVWIEKDKKQIIYIPAGETVIIGGKEF